MDDLLVVGLDLCTQREVRVGDAPKHVWKPKGDCGDGTLVCLHCYEGDGIPAGTRVPLLYRGRAHGKRRPHLTHPKGLGPPGGHSRETLWHANAKIALASWARTLPQVATVYAERWTEDGRRRSDVAVHLIDGTRLAFEVQRQPITDDAWLARHRDYGAAGVVDIWLWHPATGVPGICMGQAQCHWQLSDDLERIGIPVAAAHRIDVGHIPADIDPLQARHYPPCPGDAVEFDPRPLTQIQVSGDGLVLPAELRAHLGHAAKAAHQHRTRLRQVDEKEGRPAVTSQSAATGLPSTSYRADAALARAQEPIPLEVHELRRIDGRPPKAPLELRRYRCQATCRFLSADALTDGTHKLVER